MEKSLIVAKGTADLSFEESHQELYNIIHTFQARLSAIEDIVGLVYKVLSNQSASVELKEIFMNLSHDKHGVSDIVKDEDITDIKKSVFALKESSQVHKEKHYINSKKIVELLDDILINLFIGKNFNYMFMYIYSRL